MINCIIIDDEPLARKGLREYISDVDFLQLVGEYDNPLKATEKISSGDVQLLFLDIQMPKITGLDFMKTLQKPLPVIFTTAFPQYALDGFELNALDYLVKPISFDRFLKAALKAKEYYEVRQKNDSDTTAAPEKQEYFFIKADNRLVKVSFDDILFIEALQNYVVVHTREKKLITYLTFKSVEEYLPSAQFIKVHKSFIIAFDKVDSFEGNQLFIGRHCIPVSRNFRDVLVSRIAGS